MKIFNLLGVTTFDDALEMLSTVRELAQRTWSFSIAARFGSVSLIDLPCQACEFGGILGAVKLICGGGDDEAVLWLLKELPGSLEELKSMSRLLKARTET